MQVISNWTFLLEFSWDGRTKSFKLYVERFGFEFKYVLVYPTEVLRFGHLKSEFHMCVRLYASI